MPKRGRPHGSTQTSKSMLTSELRETIKLNKRLRETLEGLVNDIQKELNKLPLEKKLEVVAALSLAMHQSTKGLEGIAKHITNVGEETEEATPLNVEEILDWIK